ncbi:DUF4235 domain-containing protein [Streptomyces sp. NPDC057474]|uniref:DUF4235 domain-containing protein n=1 Tax=Streptomyces sp. NPDC057474 TaxID=3346144 RepID=UPI0036BAB07B
MPAPSRSEQVAPAAWARVVVRPDATVVGGGHDEDAPDATDEDRTWRETMLAAVLQGAIFAGVKVAVDRGGAAATRRLTGTWPG